jgi:pyocin large subunit-like protein
MKFLLALLLCSSNALAIPSEEIRTLSHNFLSSIIRGDKKLYQDSTSKSFFKHQTEIGFIKKTFIQKTRSEKKIDFDMKIKKGKVEKDYYFVNIKEKIKPYYEDSWFIVKKIDGKFVIDGLHHFEE